MVLHLPNVRANVLMVDGQTQKGHEDAHFVELAGPHHGALGNVRGEAHWQHPGLDATD